LAISTLADGVHVSCIFHWLTRARSTKPGQYTGVFPIDDNARNWEKNAATLKQLSQIA
jgi:UDP-3-O-[3-hydroxymyristoyl] glucosamine N-acyltransferase